MIGVFVQVNGDSMLAKAKPIGYVICENGCWQWVGALHAGYGVLKPRAHTPTVRAHRWLYEQMIGPIPARHHLHHRCNNRICVNPWHCEIVTPQVHMLERTPHGRAATYKRATHCVHGHEFTAANTLFRPNGTRFCRACGREECRRQRERRRQATA